MISKTAKAIFNIFRYALAGTVILAVLYSPYLTIDRTYVDEAINENIPFTKKKKHFETTINSFKITKVDNEIVNLDIHGKTKYKTKILKMKISKSLRFTVEAALIPKIKGRYLSFDLVRLKVKKTLAKDIIEKILAKRIKNTKIEIEPLKRIERLATIKNVRFLDNGDLIVNYKLTRWLLLLALLLLAFEIKHIWRAKNKISPSSKFK